MSDNLKIITSETQMAPGQGEAILRRIGEKAKDNTDILYLYCIEMCKILKPDGFWASPDPAPLTADQIREAYERVKKDPAYQGQTLITRTPQGIRVGMTNGRISVAQEGDDGWTLPPMKG